MAIAFSTRITALRKERGLSQKEVAMSLGVSQALLSHYEKGVRECGLEFVVRCAEYFGVTTDYLLGKEDSKYGTYNALLGEYGKTLYHDENSKLDISTILLCLSAFAERFSTMDSKLGDKLLWGAAISEYKIMVSSISAGRFTPDCVDVPIRWNDKMFQNFVDAVYQGLFYNEKTLPAAKIRNDKLPPFANTLVTAVEDYVIKIATSYDNKEE
ncbi:MAG: helix-turn-helix transcriptional regulator [Clostridia bacterium]|nr:helix-turn-helix transcriptional regulator [Clostridia bacterium]